MNFFEQQDHAREKTRKLVFLYALAVLGIVFLVNVLCYCVVWSIRKSPVPIEEWIYSSVCAEAIIGTIGVIVLGAIWGTVKLSGGGTSVADMVGATPLDYTNLSFEEARYVNVVQEMSIASGMPTPALYVMKNEAAINAFVAGYSPMRAVLVITEGALQSLTREELQGVIGHEFSHIFNGDMHLNLRLMAILSGITALSAIGWFLFRTTVRRRSSKSSAITLGLGIGFYLIGLIGILFAKIIQAAISRQREFLADACAVQYTRDPIGIAKALEKIAGHPQGTRLVSGHAGSISHLCFGQVGFLFNLFATHPPISKRLEVLVGSSAKPLNTQTEEKHWMGSVGVVSPTQLVRAQQTLQSFSPVLQNALLNEQQAQEIILGLLGDPVFKKAESLSSVAKEDYVTIITLALPRIVKDKQDFFERCKNTVYQSGKMSIFKFAVLCMLQKQWMIKHSNNMLLANFKSVEKELGALFSLLCVLGADDRQKQEKDFNLVINDFTDKSYVFIPKEHTNFSALLVAFKNLDQLNFVSKQKVLHKALFCIQQDGTITSDKANLVRALSAALGIPLGPNLSELSATDQGHL